MFLTAAPMTVGKSLSYYTGIFSTAVTASVNPTATMAALSALGALENAYRYSPDSSFFNSLADTLNGIPVINTAAELPIANPYAAVFLTIVAAVMIVLHSFAESKIVSQATIDKLDKFTGWLGVTALSVMPLLTTESLEKTSQASKNAAAAAVLHASRASAGAPWYVWVIGIITLIAASAVYFCCYSCVDNIGTICAAIPVKGLNILEQIIKAVIHAGMILLQLTFPMLSFIVSVIAAILGILLFRVLKRITFYYKEVYIRPVLHLIFRKDKPVSRIHKKLPRRIRRTYKDIDLGFPVFAIKGVRGLKSRAPLWFVKELSGDCRLIMKKNWGRICEYPVSELREANPGAALISKRRFTELRSPDKKLSIVIGNSYKEFVEDIGRGLGFPVKAEAASADEKDGITPALQKG